MPRGYPHPADHPERARRMRADGMRFREIADALGVPISTANRWITDPDGSLKRARVEGYRGTCKTCGAPTNGNNGASKAPEFCIPCFGDERRIWSRETVLDAVLTFADRYGRQPAATDWCPNMARRVGRHDRAERFYRDGCWPSATSVLKVFGSWNAAIEAAGFEPIDTNNHGPGSLSEADKQRTVELYRAGVSFRRIAAEMGVTDVAIRYRLKRAGELPSTRERVAA